MQRGHRRTAAERRAGARRRVAHRDQAGDDRLAVEHEASAAVGDPGDAVDPRHGFGVDPLGDGRERTDDPFPHLGVAAGAQRGVTGAGEQHDRPVARVGNGGERRHRVVLQQRRAEQVRQRAVRRAVVPGVVDERPGCVLLRRAPPADRSEVVAERRPSSRCIDHQVGRHDRAAHGRDAGDMRDAGDELAPRGEPAHGRAAPYLDARLGGGHSSERRFDHRAATGHLVEAFVTVAPATGHPLGQRPDAVVPQRPVRLECGHDVGQVVVEDLAESRQEGVRQSELRHTASLPVVPRVGRSGRRGGVALQEGHVVTVAGQQDASDQPGDAASDHHDLRHPCLLRRCDATGRRRHPSRCASSPDRAWRTSGDRVEFA